MFMGMLVFGEFFIIECELNLPVYSEFSIAIVIVECVAGYHAGEFSVVEYVGGTCLVLANSP